MTGGWAKRLEGVIWRLQTGWGAVGGGQRVHRHMGPSPCPCKGDPEGGVPPGTH